ncbi:hypothetical protein nomine_97 [Escherichia phage nomine]|uniref:Uncharacterized protein n=1 Tax=Escherichia phage nomine TaxID=2696435 RepID=A0A6B9XIP7_9CAUD|nr:hypothetical protein nomine_97 [Escherichia phage nomine]
MKGNATHLGNVVINDTEAREHKEEYEKMVVNLAGGRQVDSIIKII